MNPLLRKEIRLIGPAWLAVLLLETGLPWIIYDDGTAAGIAPFLFSLGMVLLAVDSFGREFTLGTFSSLMVQPLARRQIWRTKLSVLLIAAGLIFAAYVTSGLVSLHLTFVDGHSVWSAVKTMRQSDFDTEMLVSGAFLLAALTGGLWAALLLRQAVAAFWIALLTPAGLLVLTYYALSLINQNPSDRVAYTVLYGMAGLYITFAFWLAHRLFFRAEDAGWTGGIIAFSRRRGRENARQTGISQRRRRPLAALLKKEIQLHSISLFGAMALLGLHGLVFILRVVYVKSHPNTTAVVVSDCFWMLWLILPLVIGCTAVAEERKLGVAEEQFCLPVSRRRQFLIKLMFTLFVGVLLGGVVPVVLETAAVRLGLPSETFKNSNSPLHIFFMSILAAGMAGVGFVASTLARNFLHAFSIALVIIVGCCLAAPLIEDYGRNRGFLEAQRILWFGLVPVSWGLLVLIGLPTLTGTGLWLLFRNFNYFQENSRLWRRNVAGILGAGLFVCVSSAAIYQRPWEIFQPAEPPHGLARFSPANPPRMQGENPSDLRVQLPDGRVWCDNVGFMFRNDRPTLWNILWVTMFDPLPHSTGPQAFVAGSNWVSTTASFLSFWDDTPTPPTPVWITGYRDTVGIRSDGTLWISSEAKPFAWTGANMRQFGSETNWRQVVVRPPSVFLLLKNDGTLWQWGTNKLDWSQWRTHWPSVRNFQLRQIGTDADWQEIGSSAWPGIYAQKTDASLWSVNLDGQTGNAKFERQTNLDPIVPQTFSACSDQQMAFVGKDGTLWLARQTDNANRNGSSKAGFVQIGRDTQWRAVTVSWQQMVALKNDGTLWQWDLSSAKSTGEAVKIPPTRLGIHQDWVSLARVWLGTVSLAADGSLWYWPDPRFEQATWLKLPRQPECLGNVLVAKSDESK